MCGLCKCVSNVLLNNLATLRMSLGQCSCWPYCLIMLPSNGLTCVDPWSSIVWPFKKYSLECLHVWNKSYFMTISWKCAEHAQKGPTSQFWGLFGNSEKLSWSFNRSWRWYKGLQLSFTLFSLMINGLVVSTRWKYVVRLGWLHWIVSTVANRFQNVTTAWRRMSPAS